MQRFKKKMALLNPEIWPFPPISMDIALPPARRAYAPEGGNWRSPVKTLLVKYYLKRRYPFTDFFARF